MCQNSFDSLSQSIIPILTKVKVTDIEFDLDLMRDNLANQLKQAMENQVTKAIGNFQQVAEDGLQDPNLEHEHNEILEEIQRQNDFLQTLAYQLVVYDPLERSIPINCEKPEDNQAIGRNEILQKIKGLSNIRSYSLNVPLSNEMFQKL